MEAFDGNKSLRNDFKRISSIENVHTLPARLHGMESEITPFVLDVWATLSIWVVADASEQYNAGVIQFENPDLSVIARKVLLVCQSFLAKFLLSVHSR